MCMFIICVDISLWWEIPFIALLSNRSENEKSNILESTKCLSTPDRSINFILGFRFWSSQKTEPTKRMAGTDKKGMQETNEKTNYLCKIETTVKFACKPHNREIGKKKNGTIKDERPCFKYENRKLS